MSHILVCSLLLGSYYTHAFSPVPSAIPCRPQSSLELREAYITLRRMSTSSMSSSRLAMSGSSITANANADADTTAGVNSDPDSSVPSSSSSFAAAATFTTGGIRAHLQRLSPFRRGSGGGTPAAADKTKLAKLGMYALLSYGCVSNFSYVTTVICAWVIHGKASGMSPLAAGQWKQFFAIYTGLWAANNFLRPVRFSIAVFLAPTFDKLIGVLEHKFRLSKNASTALCVFLVNICGTFSYLFGGLFIATRIMGVPLLP